MNPPTRPPPEILFIHNRRRYDGHIRHLSDAGLRVSEAHATVAVAQAMRLQPDIIVLDFDCNGELVAQLKGDPRTGHIPLIALAKLARRADDDERKGLT